MAEIKSTMELVMERANSMGKASKEEINREKDIKEGMKLAAAYLNGEKESISDSYKSQPENRQQDLRTGIAQGLLRNISLPHNQDNQQRAEKALLGVIDLGENEGEITAICQELKKLVGQYLQHREQLQNQLEEQVKMQYEQLMAGQMDEQAADLGGIEETLKKQISEEWNRVEGELNSQYNQALEQYQQQLRMRLGV